MNRAAEITLEAMPAAAIVGMTTLGADEQPTTAIDTNPEIDAALIAQRIVERRSPTPNQPEGGTS